MALSLVVGLVTVGAGCAATTSQTTTNAGQNGVAAAPAPVVADNGNGTIPVANTNAYTDYTPSALAKAEASGNRTVLFIAALGWCPSCQQADRDFKAHLGQIPKDVTILVANYDTEKTLEQQYGVTHQDTFIQVDKEGKAVTQWTSGGQGIQSLLDNLK